jgi:hypothetical protein
MSRKVNTYSKLTQKVGRTRVRGHPPSFLAICLTCSREDTVKVHVGLPGTASREFEPLLTGLCSQASCLGLGLLGLLVLKVVTY